MFLQVIGEVLGLSKGEEWGVYCSACNPIWFDASGTYGVGKNPNPESGEGIWHGEFDRVYVKRSDFEKVEYEGRIVYLHKVTGENVFADPLKYAVKVEDFGGFFE